MFDLKDGLIYKACKNIKEAKDNEQESLYLLKDIANRISENIFYINDAVAKSNSINNNYIYNTEIDFIWKSSFGKTLNLDDREDVINNFGIYFSLLKSFLNDLYVLVAYGSDERAFRFDDCKGEINKITKIIESNNNEQHHKMLNFDGYYHEAIEKILLQVRIHLSKEYAVDEIKNSSDFEEKIKNEEVKIKELRNTVSDLEDVVAKAALVKDFEEYVDLTQRKLTQALKERKFYFRALLVVPVTSIILSFLFSSDITSVGLRVFSSIILTIILGAMLRVAMRTVDQLEQIINKIGNKTALIYYYNANKEKLDGNKKEIEEKFYEFLFKDIETKEWNSPDVGQSIIDLINKVKS